MLVFFSLLPADDRAKTFLYFFSSSPACPGAVWAVLVGASGSEFQSGMCI